MKTFRILILMLVMAINGTMTAQSQKELGELMRNRGEYYFSLQVENQSEIQALCQLCSVDKTDGRTVVCYANQQEYDNLLRMGYQPTLDTPPSMRKEAKMWDGNRATYEWDSYPTYGQLESFMQGFPNTTVSGRTCTYLELGTLSSGRKIMGVRINNGTTAGKPKFLYSSTIHGDETTGMILLLRLIEELCTSTDSRIVRLIDSLDIFIFPDANPDGTYYGGNNTVTGSRRANGNGVDMNRNYADPHSSAHPDGNAYQSETQWFMQLAEDYPFTMAANYHGGAEVMNYPWDNTTTRHADDAWWQYISAEYVANTRTVYSSYMTDTYNSGITNGADWYMIGGGRQDYMNGYRQCREITIECSTDKTLAASQLNNYWNYNHTAMLALLEQCLNGVHGFVYDASTNQPINGVTVTVLNHDDEYSIVSTHDAGDFHRPIKGGSYTFKFTKEGYCSQSVDVNISDDHRVNLDIFLTPEGNCPVVMECYESLIPSTAGNYVLGYLNGSTLLIPTHNSSSTVTTSVEVTPTDNGFSVEEETLPGLFTLTAYGNGQYYISYNGRYLARSNYGSSLTWGTSTSQYGRWYINSNGIYVTRNSNTYYLYYNTSNSSFALSNTQQNNLHFYKEGDCPVVEYTITATAEPTAGGTVTGAGTYEEGNTCTLTATPNEGYSFVNWTVNNEVVSSNANYSFTVTGDVEIVAQFETSLHWTAIDSGSSNYTPITAIVQIDGEEQFTDALEVGVFCGDECRASAKGVLFPYNNRYILSLVIYGAVGESYSFQLYDHATETELTPALNAPAAVTFTENGYGSPTDPYVLNFTTPVQEYTITVTVNNELFGSVDGGGTYEVGQTCILTATPAEGCSFVSFAIGDETITDNPYSFEVDSDLTVTTTFQLNSYEVVVLSNPDFSGVVTGYGTYNHGSFATVSATPMEGYAFVNWTIDGAEVSTESTYSFSVTENVEIVANFELLVIEHPFTLNAGWNWWSTYIEMNNVGGLALLEEALGDNGIQIKYQNQYTSHSSSGWHGSLRSISNERMYQINMTAAGDYTISGDLANPEEHLISLNAGWNWIGYVENTSMSVNDALANLTLGDEDILKSHTVFTTYYEDFGWFGDLETLEPGQGYMVKATNATSFTYPANAKGTVNMANPTVSKFWNPNASLFPNNMNILAVIELNGVELRSEEVELGAFADNGECRGSALLRYVEPIDRYVAFLTVYGEDGDALSLRVRFEDMTYNVNERLTMMANEVIGSGRNPITVTTKGTGLDEVSASLGLYPNPVGQGQEVRIELPENIGNVTVEVIDVMGRVILTYRDAMHCVSTPNAPGVYTIRVTNEQGLNYHGKLIIK